MADHQDTNRKITKAEIKSQIKDLQIRCDNMIEQLESRLKEINTAQKKEVA